MRKKIVVAISGPPGVGSSVTGELIAKKLKLKFFSVGKYFKKFSKEKKEDKAALQLLKTKFGSGRKLHENMDRMQIEKAKKGDVVIESTLALHFLKDIADYNIWMEAPLDVRAKRTAKRDKIPFEKALKEMKKRQETERKLFKKIYGFDYFDERKDADFVMDNSKLTIDQTVKKILEFIKKSD